MSRDAAKPDGRTHTPGESPAQSGPFADCLLAAAETTTRMITMRQEPRALSLVEDLTVLRRPRLAVRRAARRDRAITSTSSRSRPVAVLPSAVYVLNAVG